MIKSVLILSPIFHECNEKFNSIHSLIKGLVENDIEVYATSGCKYCTHSVEEDDIVEVGKKVDMIILKYIRRPKLRLNLTVEGEGFFNKIFEIDRPEITIYLDHFERSWNNTSSYEGIIHTFMYNYCKAYFKRESTYETIVKNIIPFNLTYDREGECPKNYMKELDVYCSFAPNSKVGQVVTGLRMDVINVCNLLKKEGFNVLIKGDCPTEEYIHNIRRSYIAVDAHGGGQINIRFYEIVANRCLCFRQKYSVKLFKDFDHEMIVEFENVNQLYKRLHKFLTNKEKILEMSENAYQHYQQYHSPKGACRYLLNKCEKLVSS